MPLVKNEGKRGVVLASVSSKGLEQLLELDIVEGPTKIGNHGTMTDRDPGWIIGKTLFSLQLTLNIIGNKMLGVCSSAGAREVLLLNKHCLR